MVLELLIFSKCSFYRLPTTIYKEGSILPEKNTLYLPLDSSKQYSISIDGSTSSSGLVVSDLEHRFPLYLMNVIRDSNEELTYMEYTDSFIRLLESILKRKTVDGKNQIKYMEIESPFYNPKAGKESYQTLKSQFDRVVKLASTTYGVITYSTPPQAWKSWYLAPVKEKWGLKFNKSNKEEIRRYGVQYLESFDHVKNSADMKKNLDRATVGSFVSSGKTYGGFSKGDVWDALGIDRFFFGNKFIESEDTGETIINVGKEMAKTRKGVISHVFFCKEDDMDEIDSTINCVVKAYQAYLEDKGIKKELKDIPLYKFIYCQDISLNDNIRVLRNQISLGVFYTVTPININMMPDLYCSDMFKDGKPKATLRPSSKVLVVGYGHI